MQNATTTWMDLRRAAAHASVSVPTLRREIKSGRLAAFRVGGRKAIRLRLSDVDDWMLGGGARETPAAQ